MSRFAVIKHPNITPEAVVAETALAFLPPEWAFVRWVDGTVGGSQPRDYVSTEELQTALTGLVAGTVNLSGYVTDGELTQALAGLSSGGGGGPVTAAAITDASDLGRTVLKAANAAAARTALGAGTSSLALGTTSGTASDALHTHTSAGVTDFTEAVQDAVAALLAAGTGVTVSYDDAAGKLTLTAASGTGGSTDPEVVRDTIGVALAGVGLVSVVVNDASDTITISTTATANSTDAQLRDRSTHTGTQTASTISDFTEASQDAIGALFAAGTHTNATVTYDDANNKISVAATVPPALLLWAAKSPEGMAVGPITYNTAGATTGHNVAWPDGATGVYAGTASTTFPGSIDTYTVTHVLSGTTTTTYTQPAVTRDATTGQVTTRPAVTVTVA